jgi:hypothetical protein
VTELQPGTRPGRTAGRRLLRGLLERIEAKEREVLHVMITVPLLNHAGMDVVAVLRALSENGLSVILA